MMKRQLSIVVPVYNVEKHLQRCIESLLKQKVDNYEIILVDDGSSDSSPAMCDEYAQKYAHIKVLHKTNGGLGFARNSGMAMAEGKYIAFVDSDDTVSQDFFSELLDAAQKTNADICIGGMTDMYETQQKVSPHLFAGKIFLGRDIQNELLPSMLGYDKYGANYAGMSVCKGIYSLKIIADNNIQFHSEREYISEDAIFDIDFLSCCNTAAIIDSVGYHYYHNAGTLTTKYRPERFEQIKKLYLYEKHLVQNRKYNVELCERITSMFLANLRVTIMQEVAYRRNFHSSRTSIKNMICDECVQTAIKAYDYSKMPPKQKLFCEAISNKNTMLVYAMASLQNHRKRKELF